MNEADVTMRSWLADPANTLVLDGGLGSTLSNLGADLNHPLWSARMIKDDPDRIERVHDAFFAAGAAVATTATYQASYAGFASFGIEHDEAGELIREAVRIAQRSASNCFEHTGRTVYVAGSCGPFGATLNNGSEYTGDYAPSHADLVGFHLERARMLASEGVDVLAFETIPNGNEVAAICAVLDELGNVPAWISVQCRDGEHIASGEHVGEVLSAAALHPQVIAIGCNCTHPRYVSQVLSSLRSITDKPLIVYPNRGGEWDSSTKTWIGSDETFTAAHATAWRTLGAQLIGGCCGVGPDLIIEVAAVVSARGQAAQADPA